MGSIWEGFASRLFAFSASLLCCIVLTHGIWWKWGCFSENCHAAEFPWPKAQQSFSWCDLVCSFELHWTKYLCSHFCDCHFALRGGTTGFGGTGFGGKISVAWLRHDERFCSRSPVLCFWPAKWPVPLLFWAAGRSSSLLHAGIQEGCMLRGGRGWEALRGSSSNRRRLPRQPRKGNRRDCLFQSFTWLWTLYILRSYCRGDTNEELSFCAVLVSAGWSRILVKWTPFLRQGARVILYKLSQPRCLSLERSTQCNRTNPYKSESSKDSVFFHSEFIHRKRRHQLIWTQFGAIAMPTQWSVFCFCLCSAQSPPLAIELHFLGLLFPLRFCAFSPKVHHLFVINLTSYLCLAQSW